MEPMIISKDNRYLKTVRALHNAKGRREHGLYLAEGLVLSEEAACYGDCAFCLIEEKLASDSRSEKLRAMLTAKSVPWFTVDAELLQRAAATEHSQGVLTAVRLPQNNRPQRCEGWYVYSDRISDPGNLGTIWRSAHAAGAAALLLSADSVDPFNPKVVRSTMGAVFKLPVYCCRDDEDALALFGELAALPLTARANGRDIRDCRELLRDNHVWIMGAEAAGVSRFWLEHESAGISLPMRPDAESLNVASAAAVLFYQSFFARDGRLSRE